MRADYRAYICNIHLHDFYSYFIEYFIAFFRFADVSLSNLVCPEVDYVAQGHLKFEILNLKIWSYKYILMPSFGVINIF